MRRIAATIAAWALCFGTAFAAPAVVSTGSGAAACTASIALGATPTNGLLVGGVFMGSAGLSSPNIKDSNLVQLGHSQADMYIFAANYIVSGSPTATYAFAAGGGPCTYEAIISVSGAQFGSTNGSMTTSSSVTALAGDILLCAVKGTATLGNISATISGAGTVTTLGTPTTTLAAGYATATGGTATCAAGGTGAATTYSAIQDYTAAATASGCPPYPFSCVFRPA